jgi:predicted DNA-binding transcriptional regulator AlpA
MNKNRIEREILDVPQVAELTGYAIEYIYQLCHKRAIPYSKLNKGKLVFSRRKILEWILEKNKVKTQDELAVEVEEYS